MMRAGQWQAASHLCLTTLIVAAMQNGLRAESAARPTDVAVLIGDAPGSPLLAELDMVAELAERLFSATVIMPAESGRFVDRQGRSFPLDRASVLWCYGCRETEGAQGGDPLHAAWVVEALRGFAGQGRGLLLSGTAVALAGPLKIDTIRTRPVTFGHDRAQSGLIPLAVWHPAFRGVDCERGVIWISNAAFPAFDEFVPLSKPARGLVLAQTPGGPVNPLVEYELGGGRVMALGWRLVPLYDRAAAGFRARFERLLTNTVGYLANRSRWMRLALRADGRPVKEESRKRVTPEQWQSLELAIRDLTKTFADAYPQGDAYLKRLQGLKDTAVKLAAAEVADAEVPGTLQRPKDAQSELARDRQGDDVGSTRAAENVLAEFERLRDEALLANPLLDFSRLLLVKRASGQLGLPSNFLSNSSLPPTGYDNEIAVLSPVRPEGRLTTLYRPEGGVFVGDVDLHFDAARMLFSMSAAKGKWRIFEMNSDGSNVHVLPLINEPDVDNYDACYLPDDRIIFTSTACFTGVPCVGGSGHVCNLYVLGNDGGIRQLTVEQDHDWCPTVLNNGRVLYLRWEYTDLPHAFSRILFHMNPDGTEQFEYYGSNSYWPASTFYARPIPNHPTQVVAIVGGHHELPRMGDLVIFDPARGRFEAEGAVQRIPGRGRKVEPVLLDLPIEQTWPKFLHPYPLSEKYFLVSCQPVPGADFGVYLVDVFDNMVPLCQQPGYALLEPIPFRKVLRPPLIPDKIDSRLKEAEVFIADIYMGDGLRGVPRGTIKTLRVISYEFGYQGIGAEPYSVGMDGPWDPKRVLGTVPVHEDGSAKFLVPAYTPISLQPLDAEGKAVQLMRSWLTAMPGERVSCVGCHEKQNTSPPVARSVAASLPPAEISPWFGPVRGFDFRREVQPVLDRHCRGCHNGEPLPNGRTIPDFTEGKPAPLLDNTTSINAGSRFSPSYYQLRRFVRTPTKESDMHALAPWEYHASTTRLVQWLEKGPCGASLDREAWDRLITWIDLNAPFHGSWMDVRGSEIGEHLAMQSERRREMRKRYAGMEESRESRVQSREPERKGRGDGLRASFGSRGAAGVESIGAAAARPIECPDWPFDAAEAARRQQASGAAPAELKIPLGDGVSLELVAIPAGEFVMGRDGGNADEQPACRVKIARPFWMGRCEVTNEQFAVFAPRHDSGLESGDFIQFSPGERGWTLSRRRQPVVRVPWKQAMAFCRWLSQKTGRQFTLPTEAQWEYACRAGTATPLSYGSINDDFSAFANFSDVRHQAIDPFGWSGRVQTLPPWRPASQWDDRSRVSAPVGSYEPNPWGLHDMHGNVAEWTRSEYRPYPYDENDGRNDTTTVAQRVVRGGSWYDRPERGQSAFRQVYGPDQPVYDVGFRVICVSRAETTPGLATADGTMNAR